jgi:hypothetical protein
MPAVTRRLPGGLGLPLWINAQRNPTLFSAEEAAIAIFSCRAMRFRFMRRELVLAMRERLGSAPDRLGAQIVSRIVPKYQSIHLEHEIEKGVDPAPEAPVSSRLVAAHGDPTGRSVTRYGAYPARGHCIAAPVHTGRIQRKRPVWQFFSGCTQSVRGDPAPLVGADAADHLRIARTLRDERDFTA